MSIDRWDPFHDMVTIREAMDRWLQQSLSGTGQLLSRLPGPHGRPADFERDVAPWFGNEAALAIVPAPGRASEEFQLLEASDSRGAERFARSIATGSVTNNTYRDVDVEVDSRGLATAVTGGFLVIGATPGTTSAYYAYGLPQRRDAGRPRFARSSLR